MQNVTNRPLDELAELLEKDLKCVDLLIQQKMNSENAPRIPEVTAHLVNAGGKRLRPILTLATATMCGYSGPFHIHLAATVEFIHTATLLHDDVVDESGQRRGRPTANLLWDNKSSILVGDYLFSRAFQLMVETNSLRVLDILANASATIAEGEVLQLAVAQNINTTQDTYLKVIRGKTAALFSAATQVGAIISNAPQSHIEALGKYGDALGIAFQIVDDLLDVIGDSDKTGKNIGNDFREKKLTLPFIKAITAANATERKFWERTIGKGEQKEGDLEKALEFLKRHGAVEATRKDAFSWAQIAQNSLELLPQNNIKDLLYNLSHYLTKRLN